MFIYKYFAWSKLLRLLYLRLNWSWSWLRRGWQDELACEGTLLFFGFCRLVMLSFFCARHMLCWLFFAWSRLGLMLNNFSWFRRSLFLFFLLFLRLRFCWLRCRCHGRGRGVSYNRSIWNRC